MDLASLLIASLAVQDFESRIDLLLKLPSDLSFGEKRYGFDGCNASNSLIFDVILASK